MRTLTAGCRLHIYVMSNLFSIGTLSLKRKIKWSQVDKRKFRMEVLGFMQKVV